MKNRPALYVWLLATLLISGCGGANSENPDNEGSANTSDYTPSPSESCTDGIDLYAQGNNSSTITSSGAQRSFEIHLPTAYDGETPLPVMLMFHGGFGSGEQLQQQSSRMDEVAESEGFITVYPDGIDAFARSWNAGDCCGNAMSENIDDVGFVNDLLNHLQASVCMDTRRVYASGMSNGSMMSHRLACDLSTRITAIGPVAGQIMDSSCAPDRPVPVMHIHGTDDMNALWDGGIGCGFAQVPFTSVPNTIEGWRLRNGCSTQTENWLTQGDGTCTRYTGCNDDASVILCTIEGGGHSWPGGVQRDSLIDCEGQGHQSTTFPASEIIWQFVSQFALDQ